ncbi:ABC transporter substrate-binding protein [Nonomuraea salmonea]|uniref:ABC transporter substrate-binding protein n=1 Tax=Nonomuraea salmonea TaxID=46181 RepID=UPI003CD0A025
MKVGLIVSLTGNYTPLGSEDKKAVELAVEQVNAQGGLLGRKVELVTRDDKTAPPTRASWPTTRSRARSTR